MRWQCWQKEITMLNFFVFRRRSKTAHNASFLFSESCFSSQTLTLSSHVASLGNHLVLHVRCNCWPFAFTVVWCTARQVSRNGETVKHFHKCIKVFLQFRTSYCANLRQYSSLTAEARRCAWQSTDTIFASNFCARKLCRPITLLPSVATATCSRKTCFPQIVLLQYKVKSYLGFQNLGCHFDTQKRLKKSTAVTWSEPFKAMSPYHCDTTKPISRINIAPVIHNLHWQLKEFHDCIIPEQWTGSCAVWVSYRQTNCHGKN